MNEKHSPEPWKLRFADPEEEVLSCYDADGKCLEADPYDGVDEEDWRRIVACVNYCESIPTGALEAGVIDIAIWQRLLGVDWDTLGPAYGIVLKDSLGFPVRTPNLDKIAALIKKHGGGWEQYT